jgi:hypothetical protein
LPAQAAFGVAADAFVARLLASSSIGIAMWIVIVPLLTPAGQQTRLIDVASLSAVVPVRKRQAAYQ